MKIFYSWQSDEKLTRNLIDRSLKDAMEVIPFEIETATRDTIGSPDISSSILRKIDESDLFLADVSIINSTTEGVRKTPNPNVLYELGYALKSRGEGNLILVANKDITKDSDLPFDIRNRRMVLVSFSDKSAKKIIMKAIGTAVTNYTPSSTGADTPVIALSNNIVDWGKWGIAGKTRSGFRIRVAVDNYGGRSDYITGVELVIITTEKTELRYPHFYIEDQRVSHPFPIAPDGMFKFAIVLQDVIKDARIEMPELSVERAYVEIKLRSGKAAVFDVDPLNIRKYRQK